MISIIIPVFNEEQIIVKSLMPLQSDGDGEVIVVDGGSKDSTAMLAQDMGFKVIFASQKGRAYQMNLGASIARGEILLFLHADTRLPQGYASIIANILLDSQTVAGAFELAIDSPEFSLRLVEMGVNWRSRFFSLPYGDQAIFVRSEVFREMDGFANLPIMEDFEFVQRLRKRGKMAIASAKVVTSGRRWQKLGVIRTTLLNQLIIFGYYLGVSPDKLARWYGRKPN